MSWTSTTRRLGAGLGVGACLAVAAGCGSSGDSSATAAAPGGAAASGADPAIAKLVPPDIRKKGVLTVATDPSYAPMEFIKGTDVVGVEPDVEAAVAKVMGLKLKQVKVAFDSIVPGLQANRYDAGFSGFWITPERVKVVDQVEFFQSGSMYLARGDGGGTAPVVNSIEGLCGTTLALQSGSYEIDYAKAQSKRCGSAGPIKIQVYKTQDQANLAVTTGRAQLTGMGAEVAGYLAKISNGKLKPAGRIFHNTPAGAALKKGSTLTPALDAALKKVMAGSEYAAIFKKWGVEAAMIPAPKVHTS